MKIIHLYIERICPRCNGKYNASSTYACRKCFGEGTIKEIIEVADYKEIKNETKQI